jgi:hypothetical protein
MLTYDAATRTVSLKPVPSVALEIGPNGTSSDFENQLGTLSQPEMTKVFNTLVKFSAEQGVVGFKPVTRFSDKTAATKRIRELRMKLTGHFAANGKVEAKKSDALATLVEGGKAKMAEAEKAAKEPKAKGSKAKAPKEPKADAPEPTELEAAYQVRPGSKPAEMLRVLNSMKGKWVKIDTLVSKIYDEDDVAPRVGVIRGMVKALAETAKKNKLSKVTTVAHQGKGLSIAARLGE